MKNYSKFLSIAGLSIALISSWSISPSPTITQIVAQEARTNYAVSDETFEYDFLPKDEMPILGYVSIPSANAGNSTSPSFINKSNFLRYKDAGFNIVSALYDRVPFATSEVHKALQVAEETGLVYFVNDVSFRCDSNEGKIDAASVENYYNTMKDKWYLSEKSFGGLAVKDEPSYQDFEAMGNVNKALKDLTDGKIVYTNLFPSYVSSGRLYLDDNSGSTWDKYARYATEFVNIVKPDILAYDYYVFMKKDATLSNTYGTSNPVDEVAGQLNMKDYIRSLSLFRDISQENDIPYWVTIASYNHRHKNQFTEKQTAWTVNTSLAYGAKGIQYYTYWALMGNSSPETWDQHNKKDGLVTVNGTPHDTYYQIKKINENIKCVDHILMPSTHKGVMQFGKGILPMVEKDNLYTYGLLNNISGGDAFVGCFDNNGKDVYYIVNNSINAGRQTFKADFLDKVSVRLTNSEGTTQISNTYSAGFNLSGGQAILLEVL